MTIFDSKHSSEGQERSPFASGFVHLLRSGLDPESADPRLFRQVRILNGLILTAMALCIPLGIFWAQVGSSIFGFVYASAFATWGGLFYWLQRSLQVTHVGRAAV